MNAIRPAAGTDAAIFVANGVKVAKGVIAGGVSGTSVGVGAGASVGGSGVGAGGTGVAVGAGGTGVAVGAA